MRDPSTMHGRAITHFCVAQRQGVKVARKRYTFNILQNAYYPKPNHYIYIYIKLVVYLVSYLIGEGIYAAFNA